jgi:hypothetical protein
MYKILKKTEYFLASYMARRSCNGLSCRGKNNDRSGDKKSHDKQKSATGSTSNKVHPEAIKSQRSQFD